MESAKNTPYDDNDTDSLRYESEKPEKTWFGYGWRGGAKIAFATVITVLVINVILLCYLTLAFPKMDGFPVVIRGACEKVTMYNRVWHLLINTSMCMPRTGSLLLLFWLRLAAKFLVRRLQG